ncbi:MAG TPA: WD40 repeat domain-containing protein [Jatrophihabitans sp.]|jgi:WD40 repeat protein|uniref:WD40 repeat domain-containing protein n=1 Tax=Jatrophihabitans sp. TaxID=1932789 RepID=UPI002F0BD174
MTGKLGIAHRSPISGVACWRDRYVATAGYDNQVILWEAETGVPLARVLHDHLANQCAFSPDGRWLVSSSSDYSARLWSVPDLRLHAVMDAHEDDVEMSVFHPTRELIATASRDHLVRVFDYRGNVVASLAGHTADVISVEWSADGAELISSSDDGTIKRWSVAHGTLLSDIDMDQVETDTIVLSADGTIYAGNDAGEVVTVRPDGSRTVTMAHDAGVKRLVLGSAQGLLVSLSYDRTARLWNVTGDEIVAVSDTSIPEDVWARSCAFGAGTTLVFGTFGSRYRTFDYATGKWDEAPIAPTFGVNAAIAYGDAGEALAIGDAGITWIDSERGRQEVAQMGSLCNFLTPVEDLVLTGGQLGRVFDALTGRVLHQHRSPLNCGTAFDRADGRYAVVGAYTGEGLLFRVEGDRAEHVQDLPLLQNAIKGVAAGENLLFAVCADYSVTWWDLASMTEVRTLRMAHDRIVNGCVSLGGDRFASVSRDMTLRIWEPDGQSRVVPTPHKNSVKCVSANADGSIIATGSYGGAVALYDAVNDRWYPTLRPTTSGISTLAYDPAANTFLASSYDGTVYRLTP